MLFFCLIELFVAEIRGEMRTMLLCFCGEVVCPKEDLFLHLLKGLLLGSVKDDGL